MTKNMLNILKNKKVYVLFNTTYTCRGRTFNENVRGKMLDFDDEFIVIETVYVKENDALFIDEVKKTIKKRSQFYKINNIQEITSES